MIVLAAETSTLLGSVALLENDKVLGYKELLRQGSHSEVLNIFVEDVLNQSGKKLSDVDLFATGVGPGSFTGIRIALNTIKTFAYCYDKPVGGVNSLKNLAWLCQEAGDQPVAAMINAYKNMVYIATYQNQNGKLIAVREPEVVRVQNLETYFKDVAFVVGDGFSTYEKYFSKELIQKMRRPLNPIDEPNAKALGALIIAGAEKIVPWSEILPLYLRASEAEENRQGIRFQPLN